MITPDKIEDWLKEVQERPESAQSIVRYISSRLAELTALNEELLVENIELRSGARAEEYERRIATLENQLELIKRQMGGKELSLPAEAGATEAQELSLLLFSQAGGILRIAIDPGKISQGGELAHFSDPAGLGPAPLRMLITNAQEELLLIFDSGQTVAMPVAGLPLAGAPAIAWGQAFSHDLSSTQELVDLLPIARLPLFAYAIQASRKGLVKKTEVSFFQTFVSRNYIGSGIKAKPDQMYGVSLAATGDTFVLASKEGNLFSMPVTGLPSVLEEVMRLDPGDHIISAFTLGARPGFLAVTTQGKLVHRERSWLEPAGSFRSRGQALISKERRQSGARLATILPVDKEGVVVALTSDGRLTLHRLNDLLGRGSLLAVDSGLSVLGIAISI